MANDDARALALDLSFQDLESHPIITASHPGRRGPASRPPLPEQRVYFIRSAAGHIKIGIAVNPQNRLAALQIAHAKKLSLIGSCPGGLSLEVALHHEFRRDRIRGEWFRPSDRLLAKIQELTGL